MTIDELKKCNSHSEAEDYAIREEIEYREWCEENDLDWDCSRDEYRDWKSETGQAFWDDMDEDERDGWNDNIIKSLD